MSPALQTEIVTVLNLVAVPFAAVALGTVSWALSRAAVWLSAKTKSELLGRVVKGASTIAGDISDKLAALPPGASIAAARAVAIDQGVTDLKAAVPVALAKLQLPDGVLQTIVSGELGKINAANPTMPPSITALVPEKSA
jgi:hypothetical protein